MPNEDSVLYLQTELISCRLQEAEALTELKALKQHIKDLEEKLQVTLDGVEKRRYSVFNIPQVRVIKTSLSLSQRQQVHCGGQQKVSSAQNELQVELLSTRLKEILTQAALKESRHRLMKLQTEVKTLS